MKIKTVPRDALQLLAIRQLVEQFIEGGKTEGIPDRDLGFELVTRGFLLMIPQTPNSTISQELSIATKRAEIGTMIAGSIVGLAEKFKAIDAGRLRDDGEVIQEKELH
jgi:hypothetical protein